MSWELRQLKQGSDFCYDSWNSLNAALCDSNPFYDGDFVNNLLAHFAQGNELLCEHKTDGILDGMLIVQPGPLGKWRLFLPAQAQIGPVLVRDASALANLLPALPGPAWGLDCLCQDPLYAPFAPCQDVVPVISMDHARTFNVELDGQFDEYWCARPRKLRQNIARYIRRLRNDGIESRLRQIDSAEDMPAIIDRFGKLESSGWKGTKGTALHPGNAQGKFYRDLMADFARRGKALAYELCFGDVVVAMRLGIASDNMLVMLKTTYDESYAQYAPGRLLLHGLLEHEFKLRRFKTIEFYTNATADQLSWASSERTIRHVQVFRNQATKNAYVWGRQARDLVRFKF